VGIEPTTFGLKGRCSTTELRPYSAASSSYLKKTSLTCAGSVLAKALSLVGTCRRRALALSATRSQSRLKTI
jgi:hypothetical protein